MPPETEVKPIQCARGVGERKENYAQRPSPPSLEGGINGRKLELIEYDACDPDKTIAVLQQCDLPYTENWASRCRH